jgi:hypothetical protein
MASPALYFTTRTVNLWRNEIVIGAKKIMQDLGMTNIKTSTTGAAGRTATVHSAVHTVLKKTAPSTPGMSGLPLTTFIIFFVSAGADAKGGRPIFCVGSDGQCISDSLSGKWVTVSLQRRAGGHRSGS